MDSASSQEVTGLLKRLTEGDQVAGDAFYSLVYQELKRLAHRSMQGEGRSHTLQTTAVVHEAFLRLVPKTAMIWQGRQHFFRAAAGTMRAILIDHARRKRAKKRTPGGQRVALDEILDTCEQRSIDLLAVEEALEHLEKVDEQLARIVELRFFAGLTIAETAEALSASTATVERGWQTARAWMKIKLEEESPW